MDRLIAEQVEADRSSTDRLKAVCPPEVPRTICRVQSRICIGGPARQTIYLASEMNHGRYRTILIGGGLEPGERDVSTEARRQGVPVQILPEMRRAPHPLRDLKAFLALCRIFRKERPVLVHTHTAKAGALGRVAALVTGVPYRVHTYHGHVFDGYFSPWITWFYKWIERRLGRFTHLIIAISESQKWEICETHRIAPAEKVCVVPLGLDLEQFSKCERFRGGLRRELDLPEGAALIGFAGRLAEVKDPQLLLRAFGRMGKGRETPPGTRSGTPSGTRPGRGLRKLPGTRMVRTPSVPPVGEIHLIVAGDGHLRPSLETLAGELGVRDRVHFLGQRDDLAKIYADLDVLVLTSRNEGTPVALIEAMAAGIPIVATDVGGVRETVRGYPLVTLVEDREIDSVAGALRHWVDRRRVRTDATGLVRRFDARRLLDDITKHYESLFAPNRGNGTVESAEVGVNSVMNERPEETVPLKSVDDWRSAA